MSGDGFWKWELERRLAVRRWAAEDEAFAREDHARARAREPVMNARRRALALRELEASMMTFGTLEPDQLAGRPTRIAAEDASWQAATATWSDEDQRRLDRRGASEARRCAEVARWLDEDAWGLVLLDLPIAGDRPLLWH